MTTIVVGVDGSEGSKTALRWACEEAARWPAAKVVAVATWQYPIAAASPWVVGYDLPIDLTEPTEIKLKETITEVVGEKYTKVDITARVVCGPAASVLIEEGSNANMLVVGTRGLGGFKGLLLGSVSHQVATHAPCPVVIVPGPEHDS